MSKIIIVHSLSETKLRKALVLGGMPLPSIAAMKPDNEFTRFGNITFILKPESVNPKDKKNLFFDRDIFSQRIPELYYDIDKKSLDSLYNRLDKMVTNQPDLEPLFNLNDFDSLRRKPSDYIEDRLKSSYLIKLLFMQNSNPDYLIPYKADKLKSDLSTDPLFQEYMKNKRDYTEYDEDFKKAIQSVLERRHSHYKEQIGSTIADTIIDDYKKIIFDKEGNINSYSSELTNIISDVKRYSGELKIIDLDSVQNQLNSFIEKNKANYNDFFSDLTQNIFVNPHLKNGTRKVEYTLENISKFMLRQQVTGAEDVSDTSIGKISSSYSKQFSSYEDMIGYVDKLDTMEDRHNQTDVINRKIFHLAEQLQPFSNYSRFFDVQECLCAALNKVTSSDKFVANLSSQGFDVKNIPLEVINEGFDVCNAIKNLSSHYFEGKPQKNIHFDDFQAVVVPQNISPDIVESLQDKVKVHFYENEADKKAIFAQYSFDSAPKKVNKLKNF